MDDISEEEKGRGIRITWLDSPRMIQVYTHLNASYISKIRQLLGLDGVTSQYSYCSSFCFFNRVRWLMMTDKEGW